MPGKTAVAYGNEIFDGMIYLASVPTPNLSTPNTSVDTTVTVPGVLPLDCVSWNIQAPPAHLILDNIYVSAANTLTVRWSTDATGLAATSVSLLLEIVRADGANLGTQGIPAALV